METSPPIDHWPGPARAAALVSLACGLAVTPARAETVTESAWFRVTRHSGAEGCPGAEELQEQVEQLLDAPVESPAEPLDVAFSTERGRFVARLSSHEARTRAREFSDRHVDCAPLERAVVTALALFLEAERPASAKPADPPPVPPTPEPTAVPQEPAPRAAPPPAPERGATRLAIAVGGGTFGGLGVPAGPAFGADASLRLHRFRAGVGLSFLPPVSRTVSPGAVSLELLAVDVRLCWAIVRSASLTLDVCSGLYVGSERAVATGFTENAAARQPWIAVPADLVLEFEAPRTERWAGLGRLGLGLWVPTEHRTFSIAGLGTVIEPAAVGGWIWLSGGVSLGL